MQDIEFNNEFNCQGDLLSLNDLWAHAKEKLAPLEWYKKHGKDFVDFISHKHGMPLDKIIIFLDTNIYGNIQVCSYYAYYLGHVLYVTKQNEVYKFKVIKATNKGKRWLGLDMPG